MKGKISQLAFESKNGKIEGKTKLNRENVDLIKQVTAIKLKERISKFVKEAHKIAKVIVDLNEQKKQSWQEKSDGKMKVKMTAKAKVKVKANGKEKKKAKNVDRKCIRKKVASKGRSSRKRKVSNNKSANASRDLRAKKRRKR